jgi:hypothetical protein
MDFAMQRLHPMQRRISDSLPSRALLGHPDEVAALLLQELLRDSGIVHAPREEDGNALEIDLQRLSGLPMDGVPVIGGLHVGGAPPGVPDVDVDEIQGAGLGDIADHFA